MRVIQYAPEYEKQVHKICRETAGEPKKKKEEDYLYAMYCENYLENELAYVLMEQKASGEELVIGYILCAADYDLYVSHMQPYLEKISQLGFLQKMMAKSEMDTYQKWKEEYPAHLHVDISEAGTGKGGGRMLMQALLDELRKRKVKGVMLMVAAKNQRAIGYYKRMGFQMLDENKQAITFGRRLS